MNDLKAELILLMQSAQLAGRDEEVETLRKALAFVDETRDWIACVAVRRRVEAHPASHAIYGRHLEAH